MSLSDAQRKAIRKWDAEKVDALRIRVKKGMREVITAHAAEQHESINAFVNRAIQETMERDKKRVLNDL